MTRHGSSKSTKRMLSIRTQLIVPYSCKFCNSATLFVSIYLLTVTISLYNNAKGDQKKKKKGDMNI